MDQALCSFPHDPQVDLRVGLAAVLLVPPPTLVLFVAADTAQSAADSITALVPVPAPRTSLAVSFCRYLK
jgi:ethanolamine utilization microcompartment shell protein EutL